jgi:hypothetical membrane protein
MKNTSWKFLLGVFGGILVIVFYCVCTFTSLALFPPPFSPITNWLSDLGNSTLNPNGFLWYNSGCILTGVALVPFFLGLSIWYSERKWKSALVIAGQIVGFFDAFCLIMIGVFSEDSGEAHVFWSDMFFKTNLFVLIVVGIALLLNSKFIKLIGIYGFVVAIINVLFVVLISATPPLEWLTVFTALGFVGLLITNTIIKFGNQNGPIKS